MGNSLIVDTPYDRFSVHPHAHGELEYTVIIQRYQGGSSPRSWGTLMRCYTTYPFLRFIPTLMGNSSRDTRPV